MVKRSGLQDRMTKLDDADHGGEATRYLTVKLILPLIEVTLIQINKILSEKLFIKSVYL